MKKALKGDPTEDEIVSDCLEKDVLQIMTVTDAHKKEITFPYHTPGKIKVKAQLKAAPLNPVFSPKLNASSGTFDGKEKNLMRKTNGYISMEELLESFRQPEQLT